MGERHYFIRFAAATAQCAGSPFVFIAACLAVIVWAVSGPFFGFSDSWQLSINTATTIITFLMVFVIQSTQNRDSKAIQLKVDELLRATQGAHLELIDLEEMDDEKLKTIRDKYLVLAHDAHSRMKNGETDTNTPEIRLS